MPPRPRPKPRISSAPIRRSDCAGLALALGLPGQPAPPLPLDWLEKQQAARADAYAERAVALLRQAVDAGYSNFANMQTDYSFDSIRRNPGFIEVLGRGHLERQYAAVWHGSATRESAESHGLGTAEHLGRCRELAAEGYRPAALSVAVAAEGRPPVTASMWQRPVVPEADRGTLAKRQATAAAALLLLGDDKDVWPLYRFSPDPTRRSYLLALAAPLGVEARRIATRLENESDVSARRALILALGEYGPEQAAIRPARAADGEAAGVVSRRPRPGNTWRRGMVAAQRQ